MSVKKLFLPVGIVLAVLFSFFLPQPGIWLRAHNAVYLLVMIIFLVNGWSFNSTDLRLNRKIALILLFAAGISLITGPIIANLLASAFGLTGQLALGLVVIGAMPTTLSSAIVITGVCGGSRIWAIFLTIGLNLLAILSIPLLLPWYIDIDSGMVVDSFSLLCKMLFLVLLPFAVGFGARRLLCRLPGVLISYLPSFCVILTVYIAFSVSNRVLYSFDLNLLPFLLVAIILLHVILLVLSTLSGRVLKLEEGESIAFALCTAQKTLPMAISVLSLLGLESGFTLVPCLVYHFMQLTADTLLTKRIMRLFHRGNFA